MRTRATVRSFSPECNAFFPKKQHTSHCVAKKSQACTCHEFKEKYQIYMRSTLDPALIYMRRALYTHRISLNRSRVRGLAFGCADSRAGFLHLFRILAAIANGSLPGSFPIIDRLGLDRYKRMAENGYELTVRVSRRCSGMDYQYPFP